MLAWKKRKHWTKILPWFKPASPPFNKDYLKMKFILSMHKKLKFQLENNWSFGKQCIGKCLIGKQFGGYGMSTMVSRCNSCDMLSPWSCFKECKSSDNITDQGPHWWLLIEAHGCYCHCLMQISLGSFLSKGGLLTLIICEDPWILDIPV